MPVITRGKVKRALRIVVHGPEGIGKSTFASQFPDPVFIDTEKGSLDLDVARFDPVEKWQDIFDYIHYVQDHPDCCKTLVIDTADWAERFCTQKVIGNKSSIEDFGYGKGWTYLGDEFGKLFPELDKVIDKGINVVITAHAAMRKFEQPDEAGAYDRWELKLSKKCAPLLKEWADMLLFANYKTKVMTVEGKKKAAGGKRVMYTSHHPCWDAKNRQGLKPELDFSFTSIAHLFGDGTPDQKPKPAPKKQEAPKEPEEVKKTGDKVVDFSPVMTATEETVDKDIHPELRKLMIKDGVCEWDIQLLTSSKGIYDSLKPVKDYPKGFVEKNLIGQWAKVKSKIEELKMKEEIPFN